MEIDFEVIVAIGAIRVVLTVFAPGPPAPRCEPGVWIVATEAVGKQNAVGHLLHRGRDQQIDIAHVAQSRITIDALRQRNSLQHSDGDSRLLQQVAETTRLSEISKSAYRVLCGCSLQSANRIGRECRTA